MLSGLKRIGETDATRLLSCKLDLSIEKYFSFPAKTAYIEVNLLVIVIEAVFPTEVLLASLDSLSHICDIEH
jgi:hypothetical protein